MLPPGQGAAGVNVAQVAVDPAVWTVSLQGILVFLTLFMLTMLQQVLAQTVTDFTLVFPGKSNTNNPEVPGTLTAVPSKRKLRG